MFLPEHSLYIVIEYNQKYINKCVKKSSTALIQIHISYCNSYCIHMGNFTSLIKHKKQCLSKKKDFIKWLVQFQYSSLCMLLFYIVVTLLKTLVGHNEIANNHLIIYND